MDGVIGQGPLFLACLVFLMGIVVVVHELGHYLAGRAFGVAVESFSVGFGRSVFERRDRSGTRWRINWIPLGGFVAFADKRSLEEAAGQGQPAEISGIAFDELGPLKKIVISLAGPFANFVLAAMIYALSFGVNGVAVQTVQVAATLPGTPAERAGILAGDRILEVGGKAILNSSDVTIAVMLSPNTPLELRLERAGEPISLTVIPEEVVRDNQLGQRVAQSTIGIQMMTTASPEPLRYGPGQAVVAGVQETGIAIERTVTMLGRIVTGNMSFHTLSGPVGIGDVSRRVVNTVMDRPDVPLPDRLERLFWVLLGLCAAISVGVGFFNLLPLPVLDGGRVVFHAYEALVGSRMPGQIEAMALRVGVFVLVAMVIAITWGDILETGVFDRGPS
ncbi:MAG: M50 family metallopeptidase [Hyphomonas sp.]